MQLTQEHITGIVLCGVFVTLLLVEQAFPLRQRTRSFPGRFTVNILMTTLAFVTGSLVVRTTAYRLAIWNEGHTSGLLGLLGLPDWLEVGAGFLLMDLTFYYWHRANHQFGLLWRFHNVHHLDSDMDVSTSFRFHFGEVAYSAVFRAVQVGLLGIIPLTYMIYEIAFQSATMFHHSNMRLPLGLERLINKVLVTPRMHGIHHSQIQEETNSNYSVIFRGWDSLHRTLRLNVRQAELEIGVSGYNTLGDNKLWNLIIAPFRQQHPYWQIMQRRREESTDKESNNRKILRD
jgi:sterol desaturase/sphingolipid hydroxylase (fatty acid hydroxylase superfamily)